MPLRGEYQLNREGFTADTIGRFVRRTALNPLVTLPIWLLAHYTERGRVLAAQHLSTNGFKALRAILTLSLIHRVNTYLDTAVMNNWSNDTYDWNKEVVIVTGGSDGIGASIVKLLAERGIKIAVLDIQELKYERPPTVTFFQCDLTSISSIEFTLTSINDTLGPPTILINNAGVAHGKTLIDTTPRDLSLTFGVNTLAHFHLARLLLPSLIARNHGMIVTVASSAGFCVAPSMVDYAASKASAVAFHEGLSAELATIYNAPKVRTVLVAQGYTRTPLFQGFDAGDGFLNYALYPETVAEAIVGAVLQGRSQTIFLPGVSRVLAMRLRGWTEWLQYGFRKRLVKAMKTWHGRQVAQPGDEGIASVVGAQKDGKGLLDSQEFGAESLIEKEN